MRQNIRSLVSPERINLFAPEEDWIYLARPPFHTIGERLRNNGKSKWGALEEISPALSVDIGYFGLGRIRPSCSTTDRIATIPR
jgi:hypothetical protein